jgi:hypothetical protein
VPEWFLGRREDGPGVLLGQTLLRTEVADTAGAVIVETRRLAASVEDRTGDLGQCRRWETTICPRDASDPDGPEVAVFAVCDCLAEAYVAHEQAVDFSAAALGSTARRAGRA